ncbi:MAG TPA: enoyl-CoA hydratase-related protein, partial [Anaeromyxobacter sp.]
MAYENLLWEVRDGVGLLTFNRPKVLNALNAATIEELGDVVALVERDRAVQALVLTGAGEKAFIAGADIAAMSTMTPGQARAFAERA